MLTSALSHPESLQFHFKVQFFVPSRAGLFLSRVNAASEEMTARYSRALFTFHHILARSKKKSIMENSKDLHLSGICKVGYPGLLAVEGEGQTVKDFIKLIKVSPNYALKTFI